MKQGPTIWVNLQLSFKSAKIHYVLLSQFFIPSFSIFLIFIGVTILRVIEFVGPLIMHTQQNYSGDPKTGHIRILNGRPCPVFEWCSDFGWLA